MNVEGGYLNASDTSFVNNSATDAGAISLWSSIFHITRCSFINHYAPGHSGAILLVVQHGCWPNCDPCSGIIEHTTFEVRAAERAPVARRVC